jgi:hypothetical protein
MPLKRPADRLQVFVFHLFASEPFAVSPGGKNVRGASGRWQTKRRLHRAGSNRNPSRVYAAVRCRMLCLLAEWRSRGGVPLTAKALW